MGTFPQFTKSMDIIAALPDRPNTDGGLSAAQLKAKFDEGGQAIKSYLNETLLPALGAVPVLVPATIQFTLADGGAAANPQGGTRLWLLYDGLRFWLTGDATFIFSSAVKLSSFSVTVAPDTGYEWNYPVGSGDVLSIVQTTYTSSDTIDQPHSISVSFGSIDQVRTYPLLSTYPYTNAVTICAGILGAGKTVDV